MCCGHSSGNSICKGSHGNIYIGNIADVYDVVKSIDRKKGGLRYSATDDLKYKFDYSQKNSGELYSTQETDNITARELLANALESAVKNDIERKQLEVSRPLQSILRKGEKMGQKLNELHINFT